LTLASLYVSTDGKIPLIGCGGISSAADALDYARAGASFVQLYTSLGYQGPALPREIKDGLATTLRAEGKRWQDLVGSEAHRMAPARPAKRAADEDDATLALKRELEAVFADLAEGKPEQREGQAAMAVRTAAGLAEEPTIMPDPVARVIVDVEGERPAPTTMREATLPSATQDAARPTSGIVEGDSAAVPVVPLEATGVPAPAKGSAADAASKPGKATEVPLSKLLSTFGERKNATKAGKRLV
jgi:dihydroorotate dehydrogenase